MSKELTPKKMQTIAKALDSLLEDITGTRIGFALQTFDLSDEGSEMKYIGNSQRTDVKRAMKAVLETWESEDTTLQYTRDEILKITDNMQRHGGGFVQRLAPAIAKSDAENQRRLERAFPELFDKYLKF